MSKLAGWLAGWLAGCLCHLIFIRPPELFNCFYENFNTHPYTVYCVQGSLLGLDVDRTLQITNSFPFPRQRDGEEDGTDYQMEMMKLLRDVNVDNNCARFFSRSVQPRKAACVACAALTLATIKRSDCVCLRTCTAGRVVSFNVHGVFLHS